MPKPDARIDAYIAKSKPFAQPILSHVRALVHRACPNVEEAVKWGMPFFVYGGENMCHMAAFKEHVAIGFWKASLIKDPKGLLENREVMGNLGRITSLEDLPSDKTLLDFIRQACTLNEEGTAVPKPKGKPKPALEPPEYLRKALAKNKKASAHFERLAPSHRNEYITWLEEAKTEATRERRLKQAIELIADGQHRNSRYERRSAVK